MRLHRPLSSLALIALIAGCASSPRYEAPVSSYPGGRQPAYPQSYPQMRGPAAMYGAIDSIQYRQVQGGSDIGTGAVLGGLVGGLLGNQVGGGSGRKVATVAGVVGGAMVGHRMEQRQQGLREEAVIGVRLDDGSYRQVIQENAVGLQVGSRVRIESGRVYRY